MSDWELKEKHYIKEEEGLRLKPYKDHLGYWTIGYGHHDSSVKEDTKPWTLSQADAAFDEDFEDAVLAAKRVCASFDTLDGCRKGVIVQMIFQMGETGVRKFVNTLRAIDEEDWEVASRGMKNSLWAKQTPFRARRLAERMRTGNYNE